MSGRAVPTPDSMITRRVDKSGCRGVVGVALSDLGSGGPGLFSGAVTEFCGVDRFGRNICK